MTIYSNDNFEARAPRGLDAKMYVGDGTSFLYDTKEDIPSEYRFKGMIVYEVPDTISLEYPHPIWQLRGGITDNHWVQINGTGGGATEGLIQTEIYKERTTGYVSYFTIPGGFKKSNTQVYLNGILVTNDTGIKPETFYDITDYTTWAALEFVNPPENGTSIVVVKSNLFLT